MYKYMYKLRFALQVTASSFTHTTGSSADDEPNARADADPAIDPLRLGPLLHLNNLGTVEVRAKDYIYMYMYIYIYVCVCVYTYMYIGPVRTLAFTRYSFINPRSSSLS